MSHAFSLLQQPVSVQIDSDQVSAVYRDLSKQAHPDQGGSADEFESLTKARDTLLNPLTRLTAFLEIHGAQEEQRGSLSPAIADQFQSVADVIQLAETAIAEMSKASSQLQKALLQPKVLAAQSAIAAKQSDISAQEDQLLAHLSDDSDHSAVAEAVRDLTFIKRWQTQLQKQFARLWI